MSTYGQIQWIRIGSEDIAVRATEYASTDIDDGAATTGTMTFDAVGRFIDDEQWRGLLEMIGAPSRRVALGQEIRAAECELFAAMLRYWSFL